MHSRRQFIKDAALISAVGAIPAMAATQEGTQFAACGWRGSRNHTALIATTRGELLREIKLPARGHAIINNPITDEFLVFAKRPGTFAMAFTADKQRPVNNLKATGNRHFYGHGVLSADAKTLFTTENDFNNERGVIGIRDATDHYRHIGEFQSHGIGPHDIMLSNNGDHLIIANGGLLTHPEYGRDVLNVTSMQSSLDYVDIQTGDLHDSIRLPDSYQKVSLRHMAQTHDGMVIIAGQHQGPDWQHPPLLATHRPGETLQILGLPGQQLRALKGYIGSVILDSSQRYVAITSPRGSTAHIIDLQTRELKSSIRLNDVCAGFALKQTASFMFCSGSGTLVLVEDGVVSRQIQNQMRWDNHAYAL